MRFLRLPLVLLCATTAWTCFASADASAGTAPLSRLNSTRGPSLHSGAIGSKGVKFRVIATYAAGYFASLVGANGYFYAPSYDFGGVPNLLKLSLQGGITQHAAVYPDPPPFNIEAGVFVNNTLYFSADGCGIVGMTFYACLYAVGDGGTRTVSTYPPGQVPISALTYANGIFYSSTITGGPGAVGQIFAMSAGTGAVRVLSSYNGQASADGACSSTLTPTLAKVSGTLYGITATGGTYNEGTSFAIDLTSGSFRLLHNFGGRFDAAVPCGLVEENGVLYGISDGGDHNYGTLFTISFGGFSSVLHAFSLSDGPYPTTLLAANGKLFGASTYEGEQSAPVPYGTVWEYSNSGFRVLHIFPSATSPYLAMPIPQLVYDNGTLYGITGTKFFAIDGV